MPTETNSSSKLIQKAALVCSKPENLYYVDALSSFVYGFANIVHVNHFREINSRYKEFGIMSEEEYTTFKIN